VSLAKSLGRFLAGDIVCEEDMPPHPVALADGYAVRLRDLQSGGVLKVVGEVAAGETWGGRVGPGEAVRVMTGARVPRGAQLIVPMEETRGGEAGCIFGPRDGVPGGNIGPRGGAAVAGQCLLGRGVRVGPREMSVLAACGMQQVKVAKRPPIRVLPTGTELTPVGAARKGGQVRASHGWYLSAGIERAGGTPILENPIGDDERALRDAIGPGRGEVCLVTTGGTGTGRLDLMDSVLRGLGAETRFRGIRMRPGGSISLYVLGRRPVITLPGGWGGVRLGFQLLVAPAVRAMLGAVPGMGDRVQCRTAEALRRDPDSYRFVEARVRAQGGMLWASVMPRGPKGGGFLQPSGEGWIEIEPGLAEVPRRSVLWVHVETGHWEAAFRGAG
jgi:molybdopterin biosynthesis enzyme